MRQRYVKKLLGAVIFLNLLLGMTGPFCLSGDEPCANISSTGLWEGYASSYEDVAISGNYAYCVGDNGLDVVDISDPHLPQLVTSYPGSTGDKANANYYRVKIENNRAYIIDGRDLRIFDISNPAAPELWGTLRLSGYGIDLALDNGYAFISTGYYNGIDIIDISGATPPETVVTYRAPWYVFALHAENGNLYVSAGYQGFKLLDVSNPASPSLVTEISPSYQTADVFPVGNLLYMLDAVYGLKIYDLSTPASPVKVGQYDDPSGMIAMVVEGSNAYITHSAGGVKVLDVSTPSAPELKSQFNFPGFAMQMVHNNNRLYVADEFRGLQILDVSDAAAPTRLGSLDSLGFSYDLVQKGNYLYMAKYYGLFILDVTDKTAPARAGTLVTDTPVGAIALKDSHALLAVGDYNSVRLQVYDVTDPANLTRVGDVPMDTYFGSAFITVYGDAAYIGSSDKVHVFDISDISQPVNVQTLSTGGRVLRTDGNYGYLLSDRNLTVLDLSAPASPSVLTEVPLDGGDYYYGQGIGIQGNTVIINGYDEYSGVMLLYDISSPANPVLVERTNMYHTIDFLTLEGDRAYMGASSGEMLVRDISDPNSRQSLGYCALQNVQVADMTAAGGYFYSHSYYGNEVYIYRFEYEQAPPSVSLNRDSLYFAAPIDGSISPGGPFPPAQTVWVENSGGGTLRWRVSSDQHWLNYSPSLSQGNGPIEVSVKPVDMAAGTYTATLTVRNHYNQGDSRSVSVVMEIIPTSSSSEPFGEVSSPLDHAVVSGSVPFTGWALDDIGVERVTLYLESGQDLLPLGGGVFVEGARSDIENTYPQYPGSYKAGWGYMMLTNFLPGGGNGSYTIRVTAADTEGNEVILGRRTIHVDNVNAVKPFGAIDTPDQGGLASGNAYANYGWVLTPPPNTIPTDGSTIQVWVNNAPLGNPAYNLYRSDIAELFPQCNNSGGAIGYFSLDTTKYPNGTHIIHWTAEDNAGNAEGIGSRYFTISNSPNRLGAQGAMHSQKRNRRPQALTQSTGLAVDRTGPVGVLKGLNLEAEPQPVYPHENGETLVNIEELQRVEIRLTYPGVGAESLSRLPIGASLDHETGVFSWFPGPGFVGDYTFRFLLKEVSGAERSKTVRIRIHPKFGGK